MGLFATAPEQCYFCHSPSGPAGGSRRQAWTCSACGCWNGRDRAGHIDGDHPAMRDSGMNESSFQLRAHPSSSRLPPAAASSPFCHNCQANQTLVVNLLATYLPDERDPAYAERLASLDSYRASLNERYPPVCGACQPAVEAGLKRADMRAQAEAWGSALKKGVEPSKGVTTAEVVVWRTRSVTWCFDVLLTIGVGLAAWLAPGWLRRMAQEHSTVLLVGRVAAILWAVWDPTWLRRVREGRSGSDSTAGRKTWVTLMLVLYVLRLVGAISLILAASTSWIISAAMLDLTILMVALTRRRESGIQLTLVRPIPVEVSARRSTLHTSIPPPQPPQLLHPYPSQLPQPPNAVFGQPSLQMPSSQAQDEPMDWEPTSSDWDGFGVGQQRMFAASESNETGLEALLATWGLGGSGAEVGRAPPPGERSARGVNGKPMTWGGEALKAPVQPDVLVMLWRTRAALLAVRVGVLGALVAGYRLDTARLALLGLEAAASTITLGAVLVLASTRASLALLAADAGLRAAALFAPPSLPLPQLLAAQSPHGDALACAAFAAADVVVLAAA